MTREQKEEIEKIFVDMKGVGEIDYVCAWYKKACDYNVDKETKVALVSTNSICQGQSVLTFWKYLMNNYNIEIHFAYRTFIWDSESTEKAKVHCVIVGFSNVVSKEKAVGAKQCEPAQIGIRWMSPKTIYEDNRPKIAKHINPYLIDGEDIFIEIRSNPICDVPAMKFGNMPRGKGFTVTEEERNELKKNDKVAFSYLRLYIGSDEYINNKKRYCLWLKDGNPSEFRKSKFILQRIEQIREERQKSPAAGTRKLADSPALFAQIAQPNEDYILVPKTSSGNRRYLPLGFMKKEVIASDLVFIIPKGDLYNFGILSSNVHMAWMRAVAGRLKSDYRYSKDIVYNNFPWPNPTEEQKQKIEQTAQAILDAREKFPDSPLADLYDETTMPDVLRSAHRENDKAVMKAYGFRIKDFTEEDCVSELMKLYKKLTSEKE